MQKWFYLFPLYLAVGFLIGIALFSAPAFAQETGSQETGIQENLAQEKEAYFAGGCFWCMEEAFEKISGVREVVSGFMGGRRVNPGYYDVANGKTKHFETIKVYYDPAKVSYHQLLVAFWGNIDPHNDRGQFCDAGRHYRAVIFPGTDDEKVQAENSLAAIKSYAGLKEDVVTQIIPATQFYSAEGYHQNYYQTNPVRYKFYKSLCGRVNRLNEIWAGIDISTILRKNVAAPQ